MGCLGNLLRATICSCVELSALSSFAFVTGCQMAHLTCLAAARDHVLRRRGWSVAKDGLAGAPSISVLASAQRHASIDRAVSLLGLGRDNIVPLPTDELG